MFNPALMREIRRDIELTQAELAMRVGCNRDTISRVELGRLRPSRALVERVAKGLHVAVEALEKAAPGRDGAVGADANDEGQSAQRERVYQIDESLAVAFTSFLDVCGLSEAEAIESLLLWFLGSTPRQRAEVHGSLVEWKNARAVSSAQDQERAKWFGVEVSDALRRTRRPPSPELPAEQADSPSEVGR